MKLVKKIVPVVLSLTLCASMVAPSFAAQVLNSTFIGTDGSLLGHDGNGNVATENARYDYELDGDLELKKTLVIKDGVDASIDLKGNDLKFTGTAGSVISIKGGGKLELDDSSAMTDEDGNYIAGSVTGGNTYQGGGVYIEKGGSLDLKDGKISGNQASVGGGVSNKGTVNMYGGEISDNKTTKYDGGGVVTWGQSTFNMYDGKITRNEAFGDGGGVSVAEQSTFNMYDGEISYNKVPGGQGPTNNGGGIAIEIASNITTGEDASSNFTMSGGSIIHNTAVSEGTNGISFYAPFDYINEYQKELAEDHIKIDGSTVICNGDKEKWMVSERHEFANGTVEDIGADGHKITKECAHGCGTTDTTTEAHTYGAWQTVTAAQVGMAGERKHTCTVCGHEETGVIPALTESIPGTVEIDDVEVPLAGLFTRADAIGYLWQQAGEPEWELSDFEDVPEDHQWAVAIGWAQDMGIAVADLEGNFRPDDLVLRSVEDIELSPEGELQEFLNRYAVYAGIELADGELFIELAGEPDDIIMGEDAQVIFDDFFAKLEAALSAAA